MTGGPCGGKTTAIVAVAERLRSLGLQVFVVPEVATVLHTAGANYPATGTTSQRTAWEETRLHAQMNLEDGLLHLAVQSGTPSVILCDRGTMDTKAYMSDLDWHQMLEANQWSCISLRDM